MQQPSNHSSRASHRTRGVFQPGRAEIAREMAFRLNLHRQPQGKRASKRSH